MPQKGDFTITDSGTYRIIGVHIGTDTLLIDSLNVQSDDLMLPFTQHFSISENILMHPNASSCEYIIIRNITYCGDDFASLDRLLAMYSIEISGDIDDTIVPIHTDTITISENDKCSYYRQLYRVVVNCSADFLAPKIIINTLLNDELFGNVLVCNDSLQLPICCSEFVCDNVACGR